MPGHSLPSAPYALTYGSVLAGLNESFLSSEPFPLWEASLQLVRSVNTNHQQDCRQTEWTRVAQSQTVLATNTCAIQCEPVNMWSKLIPSRPSGSPDCFATLGGKKTCLNVKKRLSYAITVSVFVCINEKSTLPALANQQLVSVILPKVYIIICLAILSPNSPTRSRVSSVQLFHAIQKSSQDIRWYFNLPQDFSNQIIQNFSYFTYLAVSTPAGRTGWVLNYKESCKLRSFWARNLKWSNGLSTAIVIVGS